MPPGERKAATEVGSHPYRAALLLMALAAVPFAFLGRPLLIVIAFTVLGSVFIPFLAATLLYLNNRITFPAPLGIIVVVFAVVGALEIMALIKR